MRPFVYDQSAIRVVFGVGVLDRLAEEVLRLPGKRALVLTTHGQARLGEDAARRLGKLAAGVYPKAVMHVPIETARAARDEAAKRFSIEPPFYTAEFDFVLKPARSAVEG